ncbi:hypothetical protein HDU98_009156 [Podochytrium sp. JEL0797]|nr:hypothetical protein HDU98_009156 [Podochytrium sp. JEL0797]
MPIPVQLSHGESGIDTDADKRTGLILREDQSLDSRIPSPIPNAGSLTLDHATSILDIRATHSPDLMQEVTMTARLACGLKGIMQRHPDRAGFLIETSYEILFDPSDICEDDVAGSNQIDVLIFTIPVLQMHQMAEYLDADEELGGALQVMKVDSDALMDGGVSNNVVQNVRSGLVAWGVDGWVGQRKRVLVVLGSGGSEICSIIASEFELAHVKVGQPVGGDLRMQVADVDLMNTASLFYDSSLDENSHNAEPASEYVDEQLSREGILAEFMRDIVDLSMSVDFGEVVAGGDGDIVGSESENGEMIEDGEEVAREVGELDARQEEIPVSSPIATGFSFVGISFISKIVSVVVFMT